MAHSKSSALGHGVIALVVIAALAFVIEYSMRTLALLQGTELIVDDRAFAWAADRLPSEHPKMALVVFTDESDDPSQVGGRVTNREELARLITAIDSVGPLAVGIDILFSRPTSTADDEAFVNAARSLRAPLVLAAADERAGLKPAEVEYQKEFLVRTGRASGFVNLRIERDGVIRYIAAPNAGGKWPDSFASMLVKESKLSLPARQLGRIAWLAPPSDGTDTFRSLPAGIILAGDANPASKAVLAALRDRIVVIGRFAAFQDRHRTPMSGGSFDLMPGVVVHTHIAAQLLDGRSLMELPPLGRMLAIALSAALGYWAGFRFRISYASCSLKTLALCALIGIHFLLFSQLRLFVPATAMLFGFIGALFIGDYVGRGMDRGWLRGLGLHPSPRT